MSTIIKLENIVKRFYEGQENELEILHGISLEVEEGEFVAIVGPSGSGKSTLMNLIGVLDRPTSGTYILDGINVDEADDSELSDIRNQKIGFVFQTYNLISKTNALKNIELPMLYSGTDRNTRIKRAKELLELVEMSDRAKHLPEELSGGQKQRVAIARAMANDPAIILADEPTGALDSKTGRLVMDLFHKLNKEKNKTIVLITHSEELASETDRIISIKDGCIVDIKDNKKSSTESILKENQENGIEESKEENKDENNKENLKENIDKKEDSAEEINVNKDLNVKNEIVNEEKKETKLEGNQIKNDDIEAQEDVQLDELKNEDSKDEIVEEKKHNENSDKEAKEDIPIDKNKNENSDNETKEEVQIEKTKNENKDIEAKEEKQEETQNANRVEDKSKIKKDENNSD